MSDWSLLGGDPAPGDPDGALRVAAGFSRIAQDASDAGAALDRLIAQIAQGDAWAGESARAWSAAAQVVPPDLHKLAVSHDEAAAGMRRYAEALRGAQGTARSALAAAVAADADRARASLQIANAATSRAAADRAVTGARIKDTQARGALVASAVNPDASARQAVASQAAAAQSALRAAQAAAAAAAAALASAKAAEAQALQRLDDARRTAQQARDAADSAARALAAALSAASHHGIRNRGMVRRFVDLNMEFGRGMVRDLTTVSTLTEGFASASDFLGGAGLVAAFIPGGQVVAVVLGGSSALCAVAAFAGTSVLYQRGEKSRGDLAWSGVGAVLSLFSFKSVKSVVVDGLPKLAAMQTAGKPITSATRPMALRTTTEQFLANVKRIRGGADARTVGGFMHLQVGVVEHGVTRAYVEAGLIVTETVVDVVETGQNVAGFVTQHVSRRLEVSAPEPADSPPATAPEPSPTAHPAGGGW